jgi:hypothetical protein
MKIKIMLLWLWHDSFVEGRSNERRRLAKSPIGLKTMEFQPQMEFGFCQNGCHRIKYSEQNAYNGNDFPDSHDGSGQLLLFLSGRVQSSLPCRSFRPPPLNLLQKTIFHPFIFDGFEIVIIKNVIKCQFGALYKC